MESRFFDPLRETKIGSRNRELELSGENSKGNDVWFELSGFLRNRGFEKSGFHCFSHTRCLSKTHLKCKRQMNHFISIKS